MDPRLFRSYISRMYLAEKLSKGCVLYKSPLIRELRETRSISIMRKNVILCLTMCVLAQYKVATGFPEAYVKQEEDLGLFRSLGPSPGSYWPRYDGTTRAYAFFFRTNEILESVNLKIEILSDRQKTLLDLVNKYMDLLKSHFDKFHGELFNTNESDASSKPENPENTSGTVSQQNVPATDQKFTPVKNDDKKVTPAEQENEKDILAPVEDDKEEDAIASLSTGNEEAVSAKPNDRVETLTKENDKTGKPEVSLENENSRTVSPCGQNPQSELPETNESEKDNVQQDDNAKGC